MTIHNPTKKPRTIRNHPITVIFLGVLAGTVWIWNFQALWQQRLPQAAAINQGSDLPEMPAVANPFSALPALDRDPFLAPPAKKPPLTAVTKPLEPQIQSKPPPPPPPNGKLIMILKRQRELAAIFQFGQGEPEVLVSGDIYFGWQVRGITLNRVHWVHPESESEYVSEIP